MEQYELELIARYGDVDQDLRQLWQEHLDYEKQLNAYEHKLYLNAAEEAEVKRLKKLKLAGKTKIQNILEKYRRQEAGHEA